MKWIFTPSGEITYEDRIPYFPLRVNIQGKIHFILAAVPSVDSLMDGKKPIETNVGAGYRRALERAVSSVPVASEQPLPKTGTLLFCVYLSRGMLKELLRTRTRNLYKHLLEAALQAEFPQKVQVRLREALPLGVWTHMIFSGRKETFRREPLRLRRVPTCDEEA